MLPRSRWSNFIASFQFKLFLVFTLLTILIFTLLNIFYIYNEKYKARQNVTEQLQLQAKNLADSIRLPLYAENSVMLRQLADQAAQLPEIRGVVITASDGRVLVEIRSPQPSGSSESIIRTVEVQNSQFVEPVEFAMDYVNDSSVALIGTVRLERGTEDLSRSLRNVIVLSVGCGIVFLLAVTLLCHLILRRVTKSFNSLMRGIDVMQSGDFTTRIDIEYDDEPGRAALAINNLADILQKRSEENIRLHEERLDYERQMLQTQKLESLGVMAGGIAHDYNNLLQSILGNIELATMKLGPDSESRKFIDNAMNSGKHAAHLTSLLLTYVGKGFVAKKELDLNELVRDNSEMLKTAASKGVFMELRLSEELPHIVGDEAHIQQVVMNLIINAAESIEGERGVVRLTTGIQICDQSSMAASLVDKKPEPGSFVYLEVSDNGCGMNEETLKRLFDPFFTTKFAGRGLGMSAVIGIVKLHCGVLFVESEPGKGTSIKVLFPFTESVLPDMDQEAVYPLQEKSASPESPLTGLALVVDDEKSVLKICSKMVALCGFKVITACDGADAVAKFRENADEIAVVLMDLTMPNMDGITAMDEIFNIRPDVKVILASGFTEEELGERITSQAPSGFIRKPYSIKVLEAELRKVVHGIDACRLPYGATITDPDQPARNQPSPELPENRQPASLGS